MPDDRDFGERRGLTSDQVAEFMRRGRVRSVGGYTLAALLDACNTAGAGPEDVEVTGTGDGGLVELWNVNHPANRESEADCG